MKNRPEFKYFFIDDPNIDPNIDPNTTGVYVIEPWGVYVIEPGVKFTADYSFLLFVNKYLSPPRFSSLEIFYDINCNDHDSNEFLKLLANALRHNNKAALIEVFEIEYGTAQKLLNEYILRIKANKWHPRRAKQSQHQLTFKDTKAIQEFEFRNPADPPFHKNAKCHSIPFTPYQDEE